ncbi:MAG: zinc ribbon domain-containing protein [[Eubacterium] siraeum]|nr:zinc ribbon domain-containing protein [[Eubacterium] siraeum]
MICKYCGAEISEGSRFCTSCGKELEEIILTDEASAADAKENALSESGSGAPEIGGDAVSEKEESLLSAENAAETGKGYSPAADGALDTEEIGSGGEGIAYSPSGVPLTAAETVYTSAAAGDGAVYTAPITVKPSKKRPKAGKGQTVLVSVLLGIFIFVFTFAAETLMLARTAFIKGNVSDAIASVNPADAKIGKLLQSEGMKPTLEEMGVDFTAISEDTTVGEFLASLSVDIPMRGEDVEALLEETDIMAELSAVAADYEGYLITGHGGDYLSAKKLLSVIYSHKEDILKYTGVDISEYSDKIEGTVESMKTQIKDMNAENALGSLGRMSYILLNPVTVVCVAIFALVLTALITVITGRPFAALLTLGIGSALSGLIFFGAAVLHPLIFSVSVPYGNDLSGILTKLFRTSLFDDTIGISLIFIGIGALLIAIKGIQHSVIKRRERRAAAQQG